MNDVRDLYQELILDHARHPRNFRVLEGANRVAEGHNPLCGDRVTVQARQHEGRIEDIGFQGSGCAICMASASTMTEAVKGRSSAEATRLFQGFRALVTGSGGAQGLPAKLAAFATVSRYPMRAKCATLAWHTLDSALRGDGPATTE